MKKKLTIKKCKNIIKNIGKDYKLDIWYRVKEKDWNIIKDVELLEISLCKI
jgi:hypothetical protein